MRKTIGPHLRRLRHERSQTQAQMARALDISTSYVNLLEQNERSFSVPVMLKLFEVYGVDWRDIRRGRDPPVGPPRRPARPIFYGDAPDLPQLRAVLVHSPDLVHAMLTLHRAYLAATDQLLAVADTEAPASSGVVSSAEAVVHNSSAAAATTSRNSNAPPRPSGARLRS